MAYTTINKGSSYFNTKLYTGTGATNSVTGVGFQPDWVWIKDRSANAYNHALFDAVRGVTKLIQSNTTNAEQTTSGVSSFNTDGFTLGTDIGMNQSSVSFASWNWLGANTTVSNTSGSITSTVSANTTSGFSVCTYTGDGGTTTSSTIGHGLGVAPKIYFLKGRSETGDWIVHSSLFTNLQFLKLNLTNAVASGGTAQYGMTSSTICVPARNTSGQTYVAYCFAEIRGYSKFDSYTGNGSANGTFVYTGFKPAFLIIKRSDTTSQWRMWDNKRNTYNVADTVLLPNDSGGDTTNSSQYVDFLSNGFKWRASYVDTNASGGTFIYMAFAENPFVTSGGIPVTAR